MVDFYGFHVGKYTSPMDPMGFGWSKRSFWSLEWRNDEKREGPPETTIGLYILYTLNEFGEVKESHPYMSNFDISKYNIT